MSERLSSATMEALAGKPKKGAEVKKEKREPKPGEKEALLKELNSQATFQYVVDRAMSVGNKYKINANDAQSVASEALESLLKLIKEDKHDYDARWQGFIEQALRWKLIDNLKHKLRHGGDHLDSDDAVLHLASSDTGAEDAVAADESKQAVRAAVRGLPRDEKRVMTMVLEEKTEAQIAAELDLTMQEVKTIKRRAMKLLSTQLRKEGSSSDFIEAA